MDLGLTAAVCNSAITRSVTFFRLRRASYNDPQIVVHMDTHDLSLRPTGAPGERYQLKHPPPGAKPHPGQVRLSSPS